MPPTEQKLNKIKRRTTVFLNKSLSSKLVLHLHNLLILKSAKRYDKALHVGDSRQSVDSFLPGFFKERDYIRHLNNSVSSAK